MSILPHGYKTLHYLLCDVYKFSMPSDNDVCKHNPHKIINILGSDMIGSIKTDIQNLNKGSGNDSNHHLTANQKTELIKKYTKIYSQKQCNSLIEHEKSRYSYEFIKRTKKDIKILIENAINYLSITYRIRYDLYQCNISPICLSSNISRDIHHDIWITHIFEINFIDSTIHVICDGIAGTNEDIVLKQSDIEKLYTHNRFLKTPEELKEEKRCNDNFQSKGGTARHQKTKKIKQDIMLPMFCKITEQYKKYSVRQIAEIAEREIKALDMSNQNAVNTFCENFQISNKKSLQDAHNYIKRKTNDQDQSNAQTYNWFLEFDKQSHITTSA